MNSSRKYKLFLGLLPAVAAGLCYPLPAADQAAPAPATSTVKTPTIVVKAPTTTVQAPATSVIAPATTVKVPAIPPPPVVKAPLVVRGDIVLVDKIARTITVDVNGKLQLLKVGPKVKMVNNGKVVTLDDLAAGQEIAVLTRRGPTGVLEVVVLSVEPNQAAAEAAGKASGFSKGKAQGKGAGVGGGRPPQPFTTLPNPANNIGPIISPEE